MSHTNSNWDCIIIGAGPVGCALALQLHQRGLRVIVLEKLAWDRVKAPFLNGIGEPYLPLLTKLGVETAFQESLVQASQSVQISQGSGQLEGIWHLGARRFFFRREVFDLQLRQSLVRANIPFLEHCQALRPLYEGDRVMGVKGSSQEQSFSLKATWVIACDGRQSRWANQIGLQHHYAKERYLYQGQILQCSEAPPYDVELHYTPQHQQLHLRFNLDPWKPQHVYYEQEIRHPERSRRVLGSESAPFDSAQGDVHAQGNEMSLCHTTTLQAVERFPLSVPGSLVLGDAAICLDPLSSSGLVLALEGIQSLLSLTQDHPLEQWPLAQWESTYRLKSEQLQQASLRLRFFLKHGTLFRGVSTYLQYVPTKKDLLFNAFNGKLPHPEWFQWKHQLRFFLGIGSY